MKTTVAICTWNRAKLLDQTLDKMRSLRIPAGVEWELLVVDNNSSDDTAAVIARHAAHLPLRRLVEMKQGHSHARNCAIDAARGELLVWTDDDVLVDENWLAEYVSAAQAYPDAAYFGGPIDPWFECEPPRWMRRHWDAVGGIFVVRDYGREIRPLAAHEAPAGANMAFRTDVMRANRFDVHLGRVAAMLTGADDTNMVERLRTEQLQGIWIGTARVKHFLPAERLSLRYVADWHRGAGRTVIRKSGLTAGPKWFGVPRWALAKLARAHLRKWCAAPFRGKKWYAAFREACMMQGYVDEARERSRIGKSASV